MNVTQTYDLLGSLLAYPDNLFFRRLSCCQTILREQIPEAGDWIDEFVRSVREKGYAELQEIYTHTFDLNPVCSLEIGWQLYGENYSRGEFLVDMRQSLRRLGVEESTELPDHLTHALAAFGRMSAMEADRFAAKMLLPALEKMSAGLNGKNCPYQHLFEAIRAVVLSPLGVALEEVHHG